MDVSTGWRPPTHQMVTTPSVMGRILTFADKSTLAVCLRVNSIMFELAGRILYRHLDLVPLGNLPGLIFPALKGYQVEERERNRSGLRKTNFKGRLLEYTRRLSIDVTGARGLTHEPPIGVLVPNCATLLVSGCGADCRHPHQCKIYGRFKVDDLILRHHDDDYHNHLGTMVALDPPKRVTITYHLDTFKSYYHHWRNGSFHTPVKLERLDILFDTITLLNRPSVRIRIFGWDSTCELTEIAVDHVLDYASQVVDTPVTLVNIDAWRTISAPLDWDPVSHFKSCIKDRFRWTKERSKNGSGYSQTFLDRFDPAEIQYLSLEEFAQRDVGEGVLSMLQAGSS